MIQSRTQLRVRYAETDKMGFVYHANYLAWFEVGRVELLRENGLPYADLEAAGFFLPVLEVQVRYLRPARYDDVVTIVSTLREKPSAKIRIEYEARAGEVILATAHTVHAFINAAGQPVRPPENFAERMRAIFG